MNLSMVSISTTKFSDICTK